MRDKDTTVIAIGDAVDYDSFEKFRKGRSCFSRAGFRFAATGYKELLNGGLPKVRTAKIIVFYFFPFVYWNRHIEHKRYKGLYGNLTFYRKFMAFCRKVQNIVANSYGEKEVTFVNNPVDCAYYRDKAHMKKALECAGVPVPKRCHAKGIESIMRGLEKGRKYFIKPRCGSMGKGITYLRWEDWRTNFRLRKNRIISLKSDKGWKFRSVTGNRSFLRSIIKKDVIIESAIDLLVLNKMKTDLRIYTFFSKVLYIYPRSNEMDSVTTNISQGGKGDPNLLDKIPEHLVKKARQTAVKTSKSLGFGLAGVDVIIDRDLHDVYVVDVNAFPGFPKRRTYNMASEVAEELAALTKSGGLNFKKGQEHEKI